MDGELIDMLKTQSPEGIEELRRRFGALIRYVIDPILPDGRDAEECASDVYVKIWRAAPRLDRERPLRPFITAVARNAALDRARRKRAEEELDEGIASGETPEEEYLRREQMETLKKAVEGLGASDRRLIYRKYYYRQSTAQIAAELGMTERAVEGKLYRAKRKLREAMGGETDG